MRLQSHSVTAPENLAKSVCCNLIPPGPEVLAMDTVVKAIHKTTVRRDTANTTHTKYPGRGAVSQRTEAEPSNQAGLREFGPREHDEGLGLGLPLLPGPLLVNHHSPVTEKLRTLS